MTTDIKVSIDVVNGLRAKLSNAQSELDYWKKRAALAEALVWMTQAYQKPADDPMFTQTHNMWVGHKNNQPKQ